MPDDAESKNTDPLENLEHFDLPQVEPRSLPITSVVIETRASMRERLVRITNWHRKWFRFQRELVVAFEDPQIPGVQYIHCDAVPDHWIQAWYSDVCIHGLTMLCDVPYMLVWQWDGFIVNPELWTDEFLQWDYLGGPVVTERWLTFPAYLETVVPGWKSPFPANVPAIVGNGGFSLRSHKFVQSSAKLPLAGVLPNWEDMFLCMEKRREMETMGVQYAPVNLAYHFAKEGPYTYADERSFGFHSYAHFPKVKKMLEARYLRDGRQDKNVR